MAFAVFEAAMLWVSRMPFVLAREGYLPRSLVEIWPATETPWKSVVLCCVVFTLLIPLGFLELVILDVFFYMAALALEMGALIRLRGKYPDRSGMFVVGGGGVGLIMVAALPLITWCVTFGLALSSGGAHRGFIVAVLLAATVWPAYVAATRLYGGPSTIAPDAAAIAD
jgi:amino acid transporter